MPEHPEPPEHPEITAGADAPETASIPATAVPDEAAAATRLVKAPRRRAPKLDALLAESVEAARGALADLAEPGQIGEHRGTAADDDRLVTHRFAAELPGYRGWDWFATLARAPRSRQVTVCEIGLLPGEGAIVAPDWVPWSDRVSEEEKVRLEAIAAGEDPEKALRRLRGEPEDEQDSTEGEGESNGEADPKQSAADAAEADQPQDDGSEDDQSAPEATAEQD